MQAFATRGSTFFNDEAVLETAVHRYPNLKEIKNLKLFDNQSGWLIICNDTDRSVGLALQKRKPSHIRRCMIGMSVCS